MEHIFTADGALPEQFSTDPNSETFVYVGANGLEDFGGGTLKIQKVSSTTGKLITLKEITSLASPDDRSMRTILPPNQLVEITLSGSTSPNLFVELQSAGRRNP